MHTNVTLVIGDIAMDLETYKLSGYTTEQQRNGEVKVFKNEYLDLETTGSDESNVRKKDFKEFYECKVCKAAYVSKSGLRSHIKSKHEI